MVDSSMVSGPSLSALSPSSSSSSSEEDEDEEAEEEEPSEDEERLSSSLSALRASSTIKINQDKIFGITTTLTECKHDDKNSNGITGCVLPSDSFSLSSSSSSSYT